MKRLLLNEILYMTLMIFFICSCNNDGEPSQDPVSIPYLRLVKENYEISEEAQSISVSLQTNMEDVEMTLQKRSSWITLDDMQLTDQGREYCFSIEENRDDSLRVEIIVFKAGEIAEAVTILQRPDNSN